MAPFRFLKPYGVIWEDKQPLKNLKKMGGGAEVAYGIICGRVCRFYSGNACGAVSQSNSGKALLSLLQLVQQRPKKTVFTHTFVSCINLMPIPKTGRSTSPANPGS